MAEVDTSIYSNIKQPDPLALLNNVIETQSKITQNKLLRRELGSAQATGSAVQDAIGPDGMIDTNKLLENAKRSPEGMGAPEIANIAAELKGKNIANTQAG